MKIVRITTLLDFGGQEKKYLSFTENVALLKNYYIFAAIGHGGYAEKILLERGFCVKIFNQNPSVKNLINIWILYRWFLKIKPDVVHTAAAEANFHGVIAARLAGVPVVFAEEIGIPSHSKLARKTFWCIYKMVNKVICITIAVKDFLIKAGEIENSKGIVIYNPVSIPKKIQKNINEDHSHFNIVCVGRLEKVKNHALLIKAFAKLRNKKECRLTLVGDGTERQNLQDLIKDLYIEKEARIIGFCSQPEIYVSQADLFVLPSSSEGFGIAVVEAMLQSVPCLCSNVGGIPEFIDDGKTGWLFSPDDEDSFFKKLEKIIGLSKEHLKSIGREGFLQIEGKFTNKKYVENIEDLYNNA